MNKVISVLVIGTLSVAAQGKEITGFKDIKFGMTETELSVLGFSCKNMGLGSNTWRTCDNPSYSTTLFDLPVEKTSVDLDTENKVKSITLRFDLQTCGSSFGAARAALGKPSKDKTEEPDFNKGRRNYMSYSTWEFGNASITQMYSHGRGFVLCYVTYDTKNYAKPTPKVSSDF